MENRKENNQNQENSNPNEIKKNPILHCFLTTVVILIVLLIFYLIEKILFILLTIITFTKLISFPLQILLHILFIRYIIIEIAFVGQNPFFLKGLLRNIGKVQASLIVKAINELHNSLSLLNNILDLYNHHL